MENKMEKGSGDLLMGQQEQEMNPGIVDPTAGAVILHPDELQKEKHGEVLCYPGTDLSTFERRVEQLREMEVEQLILEGTSKVGRYGIVGRGCVSIVVKARLKTESEIVALKIRRADANRSDMTRDYELQTFANMFGVGPRAMAVSKDLFAMEFIDSIRLANWFSQLKTRTSKKYTRGLISNVLRQCYSLDVNGLDHGELSNPSKHVLVWKRQDELRHPKTSIIDYESASRSRKVSNLTAVTQFFFLGGWQSEKIRKILGLNGEGSRFSAAEFIELLRSYKKEPRTYFDKILTFVGC
jgi:putative serine/threonine protein kinase